MEHAPAHTRLVAADSGGLAASGPRASRDFRPRAGVRRSQPGNGLRRDRRWDRSAPWTCAPTACGKSAGGQHRPHRQPRPGPLARAFRRGRACAGSRPAHRRASRPGEVGRSRAAPADAATSRATKTSAQRRRQRKDCRRRQRPGQRQRRQNGKRRQRRTRRQRRPKRKRRQRRGRRRGRRPGQQRRGGEQRQPEPGEQRQPELGRPRARPARASAALRARTPRAPGPVGLPRRRLGAAGRT